MSALFSRNYLVQTKICWEWIGLSELTGFRSHQGNFFHFRTMKRFFWFKVSKKERTLSKRDTMHAAFQHLIINRWSSGMLFFCLDLISVLIPLFFEWMFVLIIPVGNLLSPVLYQLLKLWDLLNWLQCWILKTFSQRSASIIDATDRFFD